MGWRIVLVSKPSNIHIKNSQLHIDQDKHSIYLPLEDISVLVIDNPHITLNSYVISEFAEVNAIIISVDKKHMPNSICLPFLPHSRHSKVILQQIELGQVQRKQLWQQIIKQKVTNQALVLENHRSKEVADYLYKLALQVKSGDTTFIESTSAQYYFKYLFSNSFSRKNEDFYNSCLNYAYAITRSTIAKYLVAYGFTPSLGLFHASELNSFNLADDIIEPYRPFVDSYILSLYPFTKYDDSYKNLEPKHKQDLIKICEQQVLVKGEKMKWVNAIEQSVISFSRYLNGNVSSLELPQRFYHEYRE
ncbi:MAG: hypothetical protein RLZZ210_889 [Pseudomonadota bacterium]|jgi:CRISPR-associated protein Cas1